MLPNSKQNVITSTALKSLDTAKKSAQAEAERKKAIEDELEREKRRKGAGGGGGGGTISRGGGSRYGGAGEVKWSFFAQSYKGQERDQITKQIMQNNTLQDNVSASQKASEVANGEARAESFSPGNNLAMAFLNPKLMQNCINNLAANANNQKAVLDDFNNPVPGFLERAISILASIKVLKSEEEHKKENEKSNDEEMEDKEELVESAIDKLTKLFPVLQAMNDTDYNGNGVFQSIRIRTSKIIKSMFSKKKRSSARLSKKEIKKLKKQIEKNLEKSKGLKKETRKLRKKGFFTAALAS